MSMGWVPKDRAIAMWKPGNGCAWHKPENGFECNVQGKCGHEYACVDGFWPGDDRYIKWNTSKFNWDDNIYLRNIHNGSTRIITDVKAEDYRDLWFKPWTKQLDQSNAIAAGRNHYTTHFVVKYKDKPTASSGDLKYNVNTVTISEDGYPGAYKWDDVKDYKKVKLTDNSVGDPCPGTSRKGFIDKKVISCVYNKTELNALANNPGARGTASPVKEAMYTKLLSDFCNRDGNEEVVIAGKKCVEHAQFENVAQRYCEKGTNIKDKSVCSKTKYPKYHESAVKYCDANPSNDWCRCYIAQAKCRTNMNHAGCTEYKRIYDSYESVKGQPGYDQVVANIPCSVGCGGGAVYTPKDQTPCPENITVCGMTVEASQLRDSQVNIEQKCSSGSGDASSSPPSGDSPSSTGDSSSSTGDSPSSTGDSPSSGDNPPKDKTKMYIGIGVGVVVFIILLLLLLGGDGENYNNNYNNF